MTLNLFLLSCNLPGAAQACCTPQRWLRKLTRQCFGSGTSADRGKVTVRPPSRIVARLSSPCSSSTRVPSVKRESMGAREVVCVQWSRLAAEASRSMAATCIACQNQERYIYNINTNTHTHTHTHAYTHIHTYTHTPTQTHQHTHTHTHTHTLLPLYTAR
jgi:hypothetical protein